MTLETYFFVSTSIASTLLVVILLGVLGMGIWLAFKMSALLRKVNQLIDTTQTMAGSVKNLVETSTSRLVAFERMFFSIQGLKKVATHIADAFQSRKKEQTSPLTDNE